MNNKSNIDDVNKFIATNKLPIVTVEETYIPMWHIIHGQHNKDKNSELNNISNIKPLIITVKKRTLWIGSVIFALLFYLIYISYF